MDGVTPGYRGGKAKVKIPAFAEIESGLVAKKIIDRYEKLRPTEDPLLAQSLYYNAFELLSDFSDQVGDIKIVVFVVGLDRCLPDKTGSTGRTASVSSY